MRPWLLLALLAGCGDERLPDFAIGRPSYDLDASLPLDASAPADAGPADAARDD
jgi:hypothetical protein